MVVFLAANLGELPDNTALQETMRRAQRGAFPTGEGARRITLRQLATYTSGFVLPQDHPPWPVETFTLPAFITTLNA